MTVYVTQETNADFSGAEAWGEVQFLTSDDLNNSRGSFTNASVIKLIRHRLKKFDPDHDWIVIAGSPYIAAAVFMLLGQIRLQAVQVLRWDNRDRVYRPMYLDISRRDEPMTATEILQNRR